MEKPILTSAQAAYEPPYTEIIEFTVEGGFSLTGVDANGTTTMTEQKRSVERMLRTPGTHKSIGNLTSHQL